MKKFWIFFIIFNFIFLFNLLFNPKRININNNTYYIDGFFDINSTVNTNNIIDGFFNNNNECGFFSIEKGIGFYRDFPEDNIVLANKLFFLVYKKNGDTIDLYDTRGNLIKTLRSEGYPYISPILPIFYILSTNAMSISLYTNLGEPLFTGITFDSIITSITSDKNLNTLITVLDGKTFLFNQKGKEIFFNEHNDISRIKIAKSSTINFDGNLLAICKGIEPEYIEIFRISDSTKILSFNTDTEFRYQIYMKMFNNKIYYEGIDKINYLNLQDNSRGALKIKGNIEEVQYDEKNNVYIISSLDNNYYLFVYSSFGFIKYFKEFNEPLTDIGIINENYFFFKLAEKIVKIKLREKV